MAAAKVIAVLLNVVLVVESQNWAVGWGFNSHGGFPPLPASWQNYRMKSASVGYFLGNASGMESRAELAAEDRFGIAGLGWQLSNIPSHHSHVEQYEIEEAKRLKALRKDVKVMVTRDSEVTTPFYDMSKKVMFDPTTQDYWTQCGGKPCERPWSSPAGNTPKYYFNFSNPRFVDWWLNEFIGSAVRNDLFDGIYFDCACEAPLGDNLNQTQMKADAQVAFDRALKMISASGKWASSWNNDGELPQQGNCTDQMRRWIAMGANDANTMQIVAPQFRNNVSAFGRAMNNTIAAFLISRGKSATLMFPVLGDYGAAIDYKWSPLLDTDFGEPLGPATEQRHAVFTREWSKATVTLDCTKLKSSFVLGEVGSRVMTTHDRTVEIIM